MTAKPPKPPFYLIDPSHKFYRPLATRIVIVAAVTLWAIIEWINQDMFFVVISVAAAAYCAYALLFNFKLPEELPAESNNEAGPDASEAEDGPSLPDQLADEDIDPRKD